jgi:hypothetical protein
MNGVPKQIDQLDAPGVRPLGLADLLPIRDAAIGPAIKYTLQDVKDLLAQSWDQTLLVNDSTERTYQQVQSAASLGDGVLWRLWFPADYGTSTGEGGWTVGSYLSYMDDSFIDGAGTRDHVFSWHSYNYPAPDYIPTNDAAYSFRAERNFHNSAGNLFEFHIPEIKTTAGSLFRLTSIYANRDNGHALYDVIGETYQIQSAENVNFFYLSYGVDADGGAQFSVDASGGTGGSSGTGLNLSKINLTSGLGGLTQIYGSSNDFYIIPQRFTNIEGQGVFIPSSLTLRTGVGGDAVISCETTAANHGIYIASGTDTMATFFNGQITFNETLTLTRGASVYKGSLIIGINNSSFSTAAPLVIDNNNGIVPSTFFPNSISIWYDDATGKLMANIPAVGTKEFVFI